MKAGHPLVDIMSTSRMILSACLRQARKPWMHSTCSNRQAWCLQLLCVGHGRQLTVGQAALEAPAAAREGVCVRKRVCAMLICMAGQPYMQPRRECLALAAGACH